MILKIGNFKGIYPLIAPHLLPENAAQICHNVVLDSGDLLPIRNGAAASGTVIAAADSIYWYLRSIWLSWAGKDVDVVPSPVPADVNVNGKIYWTDGAGKMQMSTYALLSTSQPGYAVSHDVGVDAPSSAPGVEIYSSPSGTTATKRSFAYVYTRVTATGEESGPSPASVVLSSVDGATIKISGLSPGATTFSYKIYRTNTGTTGTSYQLVYPSATSDGTPISTGEVPAATTTVYDSTLDANLGAILRTDGWLPPPAGLKGLVGHPSGFMAGFVKNIVHVSVTYSPHAWPASQDYTFYEDIVGLAVYGQSILVLTTGSPYTLTGTDPAALSQERLEIGYACVSKRSVVDMGDNVIYACPYGLVSVNTDRIELVTKNHLGKRDFTGLLPSDPSTLKAYYHDRKYIAFGTPSDTSKYAGVKGFIFDFAVNELSTHNIDARCAFSDDVTGQLYYVGRDNLLYSWDGGAKLQATWRSKVVNLPGYVNFAGCRVLADGYDGLESILLTVDAYPSGSDAAQSREYAVTGPEPFTLHSGFLAARYEFQIASTHRIRSVELFNDVTELLNG